MSGHDANITSSFFKRRGPKMVQACLTSKNHGQIAVMWKTVSEACNLACDYCYYSGCGGQPGKIDKIDPIVLEKLIKEYMSLTNGVASFAWQGGELA
jgi:uncharacterized protein